MWPGMDSSDDESISPRGMYIRRCTPLTDYELADEKATWKVFVRRRRFDMIGFFLFATFVCSTAFYAYTRVVYSLADLGQLFPYGMCILVLELFGALSIVSYGVWLIAWTDNSDVNSVARPTALRRQYHVRVLIPCYLEPLSIISRTVLAAMKARRPGNCMVTIYLCDDGKMSDKRKWIDTLLSDDVVYVTGRPKEKGSRNGKSLNLNYALKMIYPRGDGMSPNIPITELMALFDADQTCSVSFFEDLLPYIDSGDDVGAALSPQLMHNVQPNCDIFNHQNVHFWEKMQPGMDALGFISLTGTNMILRSRALQEAGWFPADSVTEDWELGMRMKKLGWKCRYVQKYCAIGEAPLEIRNAFQQRSRWCKGHFQTFWSRQCPLIDTRLGLFYRLAYSATCVSYISAGVSVPVMALVPIVTLLFGLFPIVLNFWTVVGITVYYVSLHATTYYCTSIKHYVALWLSNVATTLMFWPFLKASLFTPLKSCIGRGLTFKSTQKGSGHGSNASLKELGPSMLIVLLSLIAMVVGFYDFNIHVNAPKAIALCWVFYNIMPHSLLLIYARFGQGTLLTRVCQCFMLMGSFVSMLALALLWLLYPRDEDYSLVAGLSIAYLNAERSGALPSPWVVPFRFSSGEGNAAIAFQNHSLDLSAGFYNDGEVGPVKVTSHVALMTSMLAWSLLDFQDYWTLHPTDLQAALDTVSSGAAYVTKCYVAGDNPVNRTDFFVFLVGDLKLERTLWRRPEDIQGPQPVFYTNTTEKPSDLVGQMVAAMVAAELALEAYGKPNDLPRVFTEAATLFRIAAFDGPGTYAMAPQFIKSGLGDHYDSTSYFDDLFWASTWLFRASKSKQLRGVDQTQFFTYMQQLKRIAYSERDVISVSVDYLNNVAVIHAAVSTKDDEFHTAAQSFLWDWVCSGQVKYTTFGRGFYYLSPFAGSTVTAAALAAVYVYQVSKFADFDFDHDFYNGFYCFAESQGRYMLGSGFRTPLVVGYNGRSPRKTWDRSATCPTWPSPCDSDDMLSDAVDKNPKLGALLWAPEHKDRISDRRGGNQTVISLENNWGMPLLWPGLALKKTPYVRCLQGRGGLLKHPVCRHARPNPERMGPPDAYVPPQGEFKGLWS